MIRTHRLGLRRVRKEDWQQIREIWVDFNKSAYAQYDCPHDTQEEAVRARIEKWAQQEKSLEHLFFAVCLGADVIGYIAFNKREDGYEVGYCFHSEAQGHGYAQESLRALMAYLGTLGIRRFYAGTAILNLPSVRLLERVGFVQTGTESVSFYQDAQGRDIVFEGGVFEWNGG